MYMTNLEIYKNYINAKDTSKQLKILAELNNCGVEKIKSIISEYVKNEHTNNNKVDINKTKSSNKDKLKGSLIKESINIEIKTCGVKRGGCSKPDYFNFYLNSSYNKQGVNNMARGRKSTISEEDSTKLKSLAESNVSAKEMLKILNVGNEDSKKYISKYYRFKRELKNSNNKDEKTRKKPESHKSSLDRLVDNMSSDIQLLELNDNDRDYVISKLILNVENEMNKLKEQKNKLDHKMELLSKRLEYLHDISNKSKEA